MKKLKMIVAITKDRVIGKNGTLPWNYPTDLKYFKEKTSHSTLIMGRLTWESLGKALPNRRNIVITKTKIKGIECFQTISLALEKCEDNIWFIGGRQIFKEAMNYVCEIYLTYIPDSITGEKCVYFPCIDTGLFNATPITTHPYDTRLKCQVYKRLS